ncbi:MAG TPA: DNA polymerase III subunit beta [Anaerohalosphaeraceae bacterium]|nr:DNA polymerase III subunit beta [Anaerohalosphaeraceae bacterium]HOL88199.1 DNA polymerase III subunit beta [Anaerohalosphaeraceae bacterium]HPP56058.1 DNA polymerase III subunit beta [Anaerohalosphaeraceae bacterium]
MKLNLNRLAFQEALSLAGTVIPRSTPKPILQCVRIRTDKGRVFLSATDLEVGIVCQIGQVEIAEEGEAVVPAEKVSAIVRETADETILLEEAESTLHLTASDSKYTIYGHDSRQYPSVPEFPGKADLEVPLALLKESIQQTLFAAAKESTRYALNGVLWEIAGKKLNLVATDGRRLARSVIALQKAAKSPDGKIIVPSKTMALLERLPSDTESVVAVSFSENRISASCANVTLSSTLVEGNFPKYEDIIPKDYEKKVVLNTASALSAVKRAALLSSEDSKGIKISLQKGKMLFSSRAPETGDAQIEMAVEYDGPSIEIGFNPQFLLDAIRVLSADTFELHLGEPDRPGLIKSGNNFLYIVMPVNL